MAQAVRQICAPADFQDWMRCCLRPLFPHGAAAVGVGPLVFGRIDLTLVLGIDCPAGMIEELHTRRRLGESPTFLRWSRSRRPLLLDPAADPHCLVAEELRFAARHGLGSIAAHGTVDPARGKGSYFKLFRIPDPLGPRHGNLLELVAGPLHEAVCRLLAESQAAPMGRISLALTCTESSIARLLLRGRSLLEISLALNLCESAVRSHRDALFAKLGAKSREEALRRIAELRLGE